MEWHWDEQKAKANLVKHGISFEIAVLVFDDPLQLIFPDDHSDGDRWQTYGRVNAATLLVVHTIYDDESGAELDESGAELSARERRLQRI